MMDEPEAAQEAYVPKCLQTMAKQTRGVLATKLPGGRKTMFFAKQLKKRTLRELQV